MDATPSSDADFDKDPLKAIPPDGGHNKIFRSPTYTRITETERTLQNFGFSRDRVEKEVQQIAHAASDSFSHSTSSLSKHPGCCMKCRLFCRRVISNPIFIDFYGILILLNTLTMALELEYKNAPPALQATAKVFTLLFLVEIIFRLIGGQTKMYMDSFLIMDTLIVAVSVIEDFVLDPIRGDAEADSDTDFSFVLTLRFFKMVRLTKIFRAVLLVRPLRILVFSAQEAFASAMWLMCLFCLVFFVFGLMFQSMLKSIGDDHPMHGIAEEYFSSNGISMLTLLEVMTEGIDWSTDIGRPFLKSKGTEMPGILWIIWVTLAILCLSNVVLGVFVESYLSTAEDDDTHVSKVLFVQKEANVETIKKAFAEIDEDDDGEVTWTEYVDAIENNPDLPKKLGMSRDMALGLFNDCDMSGSGRVGVDDFLFGVVKQKGLTKNIKMLTLQVQLKRAYNEVKIASNILEALHSRFGDFDGTLRSMLKVVIDAAEADSNTLQFQDMVSKLAEAAAFMKEIADMESHHGPSLPDSFHYEVASVRQEFGSLRESINCLREEVNSFKQGSGVDVSVPRTPGLELPPPDTSEAETMKLLSKRAAMPSKVGLSPEEVMRQFTEAAIKIRK